MIIVHIISKACSLEEVHAELRENGLKAVKMLSPLWSRPLRGGGTGPFIQLAGKHLHVIGETTRHNGTFVTARPDGYLQHHNLQQGTQASFNQGDLILVETIK
jgi:hypothetical protein